MAELDKFLRALKSRGGTDLHLLEGIVPKMRLNGELSPIGGYDELDGETLHNWMYEILSDQQKKDYESSGDLDLAYAVEGVARFRGNFLRHVGGCGAVFRLIPDRISTIDELGMPASLKNLAHTRSGLVLVTGPSGSGKSTTQAAIIDLVNESYRRHIITVEQPVEFVHRNKQSVVTQREVGIHTDSFASALRAAIREDPDVILVGEMRDLETIALALRAAELGLLVFGTLHTSSAAKTVDRIIDVFPVAQQSQVRAMLSESLQSVVSQQLLRTADGKSRVAALEILVRREGLGNMIREGATGKVNSLIQQGKSDGMQTMDQALMDLFNEGKIDGETAYLKANDKRMFEAFRGSTDGDE